jgi:hypothetical protein
MWCRVSSCGGMLYLTLLSRDRKSTVVICPINYILIYVNVCCRQTPRVLIVSDGWDSEDSSTVLYVLARTETNRSP